MAIEPAPKVDPNSDPYSVSNIVGNLQAVRGKSTVTSNNITPEGIQALVNSMLQGNQGLASVVGAQKGAGVYNSSTNRLLVNDLTTQVAQKAALANASTTTTQKGLVSDKALLTLALLGKLNSSPLGQSLKKKAGDVYDTVAAKFSNEGTGGGIGTTASASGTDAVSNAISTANDLSYTGDSANALSTTTPTASAAPVGTASDLSYTADSADALSATSAASTGTATAQSVGTASDLSYASDSSDALSSGSSSGGGYGGSGSALGYAASAADAYAASQGNGDYRKAIGGAVLNYFGAGAFTPLVDSIARPASDRLINNGYTRDGVTGSLLEDPIGSLSAGDYNGSQIFDAVADPFNISGDNSGASLSGSAKALNPINIISDIFGW